MTMQHIIIVILCAILAISDAGTSTIPVVFVHGFLGFGPDELFALGYWPYSQEYRDEGFTTFEASVGPVSSNWDRACELYAQIKGTRVDYGIAHSAKYGHARFGADYTGKGFYPQWDASNPVHLVGHSMGGQTIRMLELLLREGDAAEKAAGGATSELFTGGHKYIKSLTTLSATHDGTQLVGVLGDGLISFLKDFLVLIAGFFDATFLEEVYDFDLSHWGVQRQPGESPDSYWNRLEQTVLRSDNLDLSPYDLSPQGATAQNKRGQQAYSDTYYFSFASEDTYGLYNCFWFLRCGVVQYAEASMLIFLAPFANALGSIDEPEAFRRNDGVVNWEKQKCPTLGYSNPGAKCRQYSGSWTPGVWHWVNVDYLDHIKTTFKDSFRDTFNYGKSAKKLYRDHAQRTRTLDVPSYAGAVITPVLETRNTNEAVEQDEPSIAGAVVMISLVVLVALAAVVFVVKLRKYRKQSGASLSKNGSFVTQKSSKASFYASTPPPIRKESSLRSPSIISLGAPRSYSQDLEGQPQL